jgi:hypothetical protein
MSLFGDIVLRSIWNKLYFNVGWPIFILIIPTQVDCQDVPVQYFTEKELGMGWFAPLLFKEIGTHMYAFREKYFHWWFRYFSVMHGVLIFDRARKRVVVKGIPNWFTIWFVIYLISNWVHLVATYPLQITGSVAFFLFAIAICYSIQSSRFRKVGKIAAELCSKDFFPNSGGV